MWSRGASSDLHWTVTWVAVLRRLGSGGGSMARRKAGRRSGLVRVVAEEAVTGDWIPDPF